MKRYLPSWWKVVIFSAVLAGVFVWRSGKHDQGVIVGKQESLKPFSSVTSPKKTKRLIGQTEARTPEELPPGLSTSSMEERRQKLTEEREFARSLQKEAAGELLSR